MSSKKFYTYLLLDPRKPGRYTYDNFITFLYEPFYVGKATGKRYSAHLSESRLSKSRTPKLNKIRKLLSLTLLPLEIRVLGNTTEELAFDFEKVLISLIGRTDINNGPLTNLTDGGEGQSGIIFSQEWRNNKSQEMKNKFSSPIERKRMSEQTTAYFSKQENRDSLSLTQKKRFESAEERLKISIATKKAMQDPAVKEKLRLAKLGKPSAKKGKSKYPPLDYTLIKYCKCGCGEKITIKRHHAWNGIPAFIVGHNTVPSKRGQEHHNYGKKRIPASKEVRRKQSDSQKTRWKRDNPIVTFDCELCKTTVHMKLLKKQKRFNKYQMNVCTSHKNGCSWKAAHLSKA